MLHGLSTILRKNVVVMYITQYGIIPSGGTHINFIAT